MGVALLHLYAWSLLAQPKSQPVSSDSLPPVLVWFQDNIKVRPGPMPASIASNAKTKRVGAATLASRPLLRPVRVHPPHAQTAPEESPSPADHADQFHPVAPAVPGLRERVLLSVGTVDRQVRGIVQIVPPREAASGFAKLGQQIESAYRGGSDSMAVYESPDGGRVTRITRKGQARCYISGVTNSSMAAESSGRSGAPRSVNCPPASEKWRPRV